MKGKFFTYYGMPISNYCLLNIKDYDKGISLPKKEFMIDPGVYELKKAKEYSCIDQLHAIAQANQQYISIDYPCDMNKQYAGIFVRKTNANIRRYCHNDKYIITVQHKFHNYPSFSKNFHQYAYWMKGKVVGIGNICRLFYIDSFTDKVFHLLNTSPIRHDVIRYHFYGLGMRLIKKYLVDADFNWSVDSIKWTKAVNNYLKVKYGLNAKRRYYNEYFLAYMDTIREAGVDIEW
jgi:hypothetical protein